MKSSLPVYKRCRPLLGTFVEISLIGRLTPRKEKLVALAFQAIEEVAGIMSFHNSESDLSRLNQSPVKKWICVHPKLIKVLNLALDLQLNSDGIFNVAIARPLIFWNFLPGVEKTSQLINLKKIGFETRGKNQVRRLEAIQIDLGGIAKGYAVDEAVRVLKKSKNISGCVNAGGDLRVFGRCEQTVSIRTGLGERRKENLTTIKNRSLATSEVIPQKSLSPYVDVLKKRAFSKERAIVVTARDCVVADALTKVALFSTPSNLPLINKVACRYGAKIGVLN